MEAVVQTLAHATSQNPSELKPAEQQLGVWESELPGFYSILWDVFKNRSIDVNIRWMAILFLKNGIDRRWRQRVVFQEEDGGNVVSITAEEKERLKMEMLQMLDEPVSTLAVQLAVLIAKIFRLDMPKLWPDLLPHLIQLAKTSSGLVLHRTILTLKHVTKAMASWRLRSHRDIFEEIAAEMFSFTLTLWAQKVQELVSVFQSTQGQMAVNGPEHQACVSALELSTLALRMLRQFVVTAFSDIAVEPTLPTFIQQLMSTMDQLLATRTLIGDSHPLTEAVEKECILCTKVIVDLQLHKPLQVLPYLKSLLEFFCVKYLFAEDVQVALFERFIVQGLNFVKNVLLCKDYTPKVSSEGCAPQQGQDSRILEAYEIKMQFFTANVSINIVQQLVTRYFPLRQSEIERWEDEPETLAYEESGESFKFELRPCVDTLFATFMATFHLTLAPTVAEMITTVQNLNLHDAENCRMREAVYSAVGLAVHELYEQVNFSDWFEQRLQHELMQTSSKYLRRRILWLVGQWADVCIPQQVRPVIYPHLLQRMTKEEDLVVRLEASSSLRKVVDGYQFEIDDFLPFLENASGQLFSLLTSVSECETKMLVLHVFNVIIQRTGCEMRPYSSGLIHYLPNLWAESADHNMLRCAIVTALARLVRALGPLCVQLYNLLLPIISHCTDISHPAHIYLLEDGLELWHLTLSCSPSCTIELLNQFAAWHDLLDLREHLNVLMNILYSYLCLDPTAFLQMYGGQLVETFNDLLTDVRPEAAVLVFRRIHSVFKIAPQQASVMFKPLVFEVLSCLLYKPDGGMGGSNGVQDGCQLYELMFDGEYMPLLTQYVALLARILLQNLEIFVEVLSLYGQQRNLTANDVLMMLLDVWLEKFDAMPEVESRKLTALALTCLLPKFNWPGEQFAVIIDALVDVLHQVHRCDEDGVVSDKLVYPPELCEIEADDDYTEEENRVRRFRLVDPVHTRSLRDCTRATLQQIQSEHGQQRAEELMASLDVEVRQQLQAFLDA